MIHRLRQLAALAVTGLLASHYTTVGAQVRPTRTPAAEPVNTILFVGNSFFHGKYQPVLAYNAGHVIDENYGLPATDPRCETTTGEPVVWGGIPGIFQHFTEEAGLKYEVHFEEINGRPLQYHYEHALSVIQQPRWNTVVLQEHSQWALPPRHGGHPELFREYATRLERAVHAANPAANVFLFQTWPRADLCYPAGKPFTGLPIDSMAQELHASYYGLLAQNPSFRGIAPAGDAWLRAVQTGLAMRNPYAPEPGKIDLWGEDHYHPSNWGAYLTACVLFGEITGRDPRTLGAAEQAAVALGIGPAEAVALQRVAYEQISAARPTAFSRQVKPNKAKADSSKMKLRARS